MEINTKKIFTYTKNKDDFMGRENRRYCIVNLKTGKKKRITKKQYEKENNHRSSKT